MEETVGPSADEVGSQRESDADSQPVSRHRRLVVAISVICFFLCVLTALVLIYVRTEDPAVSEVKEAPVVATFDQASSTVVQVTYTPDTQHERTLRFSALLI